MTIAAFSPAQKKWLSLLILSLSLLPLPAQASSLKAGGNCTKLGQTTVISRINYHCARVAAKLIWVKTAKTASSSGSNGMQAQTISVPKVASVDITQGTFSGKFLSDSTLAVKLSSSTPSICQVQASGISLLQTGTCEVTATQDGNAKFLPARPISFSLKVTAPTITSDNSLLDQVQTYYRVPLGTNFASDTAEITLTAVNADVSAKICTADPTADGCALVGGVGTVDPTSHTKYVEFVFHVKNLDANPLPQVVYRFLSAGLLSDISAGVSLDTLNSLTLGTGESADGSLYGIVPKSLTLDKGYLIIDDGNHGSFDQSLVIPGKVISIKTSQ